MSITVEGMEDVLKKLGILETLDVIEAPMDRGGERIRSYEATYPPQPPNSRYIRGYGYPGHPTSERLGQRWTVKKERTPGSIRITIGNNASYGPLVQSARFQTRQHRKTGWRTDEQSVKENRTAIVADVEQTINEALAK